MKKLFLSILFPILIYACGNQYGDGSDDEVIVKVYGKTLTRSEIMQRIPDGVSEADSLILAETLVKKWITDILTDEAAYKNIGDDSEIEHLVDEYRRSLIRHRYQENIIRDKMKTNISEADKRTYYEGNKDQFILNDNIIKGLFLKVPSDAPGLDNIRKWYVSDKEESLEMIEKYSLQNAVTYDYFNDRWVKFGDIMAKIPQKISNASQFLRVNNHLEASDSTHVYFLNITDKCITGSYAPYDYVSVQIENMLANKKKIEYLHEFGENLYRDAVRNGTVKFIKE